MRSSLAILGSTGSIGTQALEVASMLDLRITALSADRNTDLLYLQAKKYDPEIIAVTDLEAFNAFKGADLPGTRIIYGNEGLDEACSSGADLVINALTGFAGLRSTLKTVRNGTDLALANKESMVTFGGQIMKEAAGRGVRIIPVDSEHSAVFQCLEGKRHEDVKSIILTASGGPFVDRAQEGLKHVTVDEALRHPKWKMGRKITIDSATMMNKGLEVIEAAYLFDMKKEDIKVIIHRESIIHSMVGFIDGSYAAQLGYPDMKIPIMYAVTYPERRHCGAGSIDFAKLARLSFEDVDEKKFPCLKLAYDALSCRNSMNIVLNAANEVCVDAFLNGRIGFTDIAQVIGQMMETHKDRDIYEYEDALELDGQIRTMTAQVIGGWGCR